MKPCWQPGAGAVGNAVAWPGLGVRRWGDGSKCPRCPLHGPQGPSGLDLATAAQGERLPHPPAGALAPGTSPWCRAGVSALQRGSQRQTASVKGALTPEEASCWEGEDEPEPRVQLMLRADSGAWGSGPLSQKGHSPLIASLEISALPRTLWCTSPGVPQSTAMEGPGGWLGSFPGPEVYQPICPFGPVKKGGG